MEVDLLSFMFMLHKLSDFSKEKETKVLINLNNVNVSEQCAHYLLSSPWVLTTSKFPSKFVDETTERKKQAYGNTVAWWLKIQTSK